MKLLRKLVLKLLIFKEIEHFDSSAQKMLLLRDLKRREGPTEILVLKMISRTLMVWFLGALLVLACDKGI